MFNYKKKFIKCGAIITSSLVSVCLASNNNIISIMEEGNQNNIQVQHQRSLQQAFLPWIMSVDIHEEARAENVENRNFGVILLDGCKLVNGLNRVCKTISQSIRYCTSSHIIKDYATQVAASVTSALIVYKIYQIFNT